MKFKINILIPSIFLVTTHQITAMENTTNRNLKIAAWVATSFGTQLIAQRVANISLARSLEEKTNLTLSDITSLSTLAGSLMAVSYAFSEERRAKIQQFATRFPLAALLGKVVTSKMVKQSTAQIPILKHYFGCPNKECAGTCNSCNLRSMLIITGIIRVIV